MSDLNKIYKNSAAAWWNDDRIKKWDNEIYQKESAYYYVFNQRLNNLVELIKKSKIKNPKILELGFGGGQLAEVLLSKNLCFSYTGLDVSKHLCDSTEKKLSQYKIDTATGSGFFFAEKGFLRKIKIILNEFLQNICNKYNYLKLYKFAHHIQYFVKKNNKNI